MRIAGFPRTIAVPTGFPSATAAFFAHNPHLHPPSSRVDLEWLVNRFPLDARLAALDWRLATRRDSARCRNRWRVSCCRACGRSDSTALCRGVCDRPRTRVATGAPDFCRSRARYQYCPLDCRKKPQPRGLSWPTDRAALGCQFQPALRWSRGALCALDPSAFCLSFSAFRKCPKTDCELASAASGGRVQRTRPKAGVFARRPAERAEPAERQAER